MRIINKNTVKNMDNFLKGYLKAKNISDIDKFMNPTVDCLCDNSFIGIDKGLKLFKEAYENKWNIYLKPDEDFDGLSSSSQFYNYCMDIEYKGRIDIGLMREQKHSIDEKEIKKDIQLVVLPDCGTNEFELIENLCNKGIKVLILDHHNIDTPNDKAIIINNQDGQYQNKSLSGSAVVLKFLQAFDDYMGVNYSEKYYDLACFGLIADIMDTTHLENRFIIKQGLSNVKNDFLKALLIEKKIEAPTIADVGWSISPLVNATVRLGTKADRKNLFKAFIGEYDVQKMAKKCASIKRKQDKLKKEYSNTIMDDLSQCDDKIIIYDGSNLLSEKTFTGLVANTIASKVNRPTIILKHFSDNIYGGSARNSKGFELRNLKQYFEETKLFEHCGGHNNSFGFQIKEENIPLLKEKVNKDLGNISIQSSDEYFVDYVFEAENINKNIIKDIAQYSHIWGKGIEEPVFAIKNICIKSSNVKNPYPILVTLYDGKISYCKNFAKKGTFEKMSMSNKNSFGDKMLSFDIVGKFVCNESKGKKYYQVEIIDYEVKEIKGDIKKKRKIEF